MDKKKKFFIGLGILTVIYVAVMSLNLTHNNESDSSKGYSKGSVIKMLNSDNSELAGYFSVTSNIKQWFSFLLPKLELLSNTASSDFCTIKKENENYILLNKERPQCVLFVKKSNESARRASLTYEIMSNQTTDRALNINMHRAKVLNSATVRPNLTMSKSQLKISPNESSQSNKKDKTTVLMIFLVEIDHSFYQFNNPDKKNFQLKNFPPKANEKQVSFEVVENKFELIAPEKGGVLVLKCSDCSKNSVKIKTTD